MDILLVTFLLIVTLVLLIGEWIPLDLVAIGLMVALMVTGLLKPTEAVAGFANPAVITVGAMFLLSHGMARTGAVAVLGGRVLPGDHEHAVAGVDQPLDHRIAR